MAPANKPLSNNYQANLQAKKFVEKQNQKVRKQYLKSQKPQRGPRKNNEVPAAPLRNFQPTKNLRKNHHQGMSNNQSQEQKKFKKPSKFQNALEEFKKQKLEAQNKHEEAKRKKVEMYEALKKYKEKKAKRMKLLSKKTKKGQPIMKYRIEELLEKIQDSMR